MLITSNKKNDGRDNNNTMRETMIAPDKIKLFCNRLLVLRRNNFMQQCAFFHQHCKSNLLFFRKHGVQSAIIGGKTVNFNLFQYKKIFFSVLITFSFFSES